jgi:hypothetical protein
MNQPVIIIVLFGFGCMDCLRSLTSSAPWCVQGWRWAWIISGLPGIVLAVIILVTVKEPQRQQGESFESNFSVNQLEGDWRKKAAAVCSTFLQPSLLILCFAGSVRNAGT